MWLSIAFFIGALCGIQGIHFSDVLNIFAHRDHCVAKILSCDYYRQSFSLYEEKDIGMFTNIQDLKKACIHQFPYMRCMARAEKFCEQTILLPIVEEMIKSRRFPLDICRSPSPWQQLYLREATCLNAYSRKAFAYCVEKNIGIGNLNPDINLESGCKYGRAIIDCSATALQERCGYYAGHILKKFLKFHSLSDYKCVDFKVDDVNDNSLSSPPNYDIIETIITNLKEHIFSNEPEAGINSGKDTDFKETKLDNLQNLVPDYLPSVESDHFDHVVSNELLTKTEDSYSDSLDFDTESEDITPDSDKFDFPALPKNNYIHKNRTTFALYEDLKMGHMKYIGCGEADVFWVILSPLRSKYCTLMDLKLEYSESLFKCTLRIDAPCSPELDVEDRSRNAEVFRHRYVVTVLTPPNNQRSEDMAVMNVYYLKVYPFPSLDVPEKKINLWTDQAEKVTVKGTESVSRKGHLEMEDDYNSILYQRDLGSGQKRDKDSIKYFYRVDEDVYNEEQENGDYYPLEEEDDVYFPELFKNDVIYIEDENGDLISLRDQRSPIYSKSLYQPHSLFRPRIQAKPASTDIQKLDEEGTNRKNKPIISSSLDERMSKLNYGTLFPKFSPGEQGYYSAGPPCPPISETISKMGIQPGGRVHIRNIKTFDQFKGLNQKMCWLMQSSTKLNDEVEAEPYLASTDAYVVTPSAKIQLPVSKESRQRGKRNNNEFATDHSRYQPKKEDCINVIDTAHDSRYFNSDNSFVTSAPDSADYTTDYKEPFSEYYNYDFMLSPPKCLNKLTDTIENLSSRDPEELEESSSENESMREVDLLEILEKFLEDLLESIEKA